MKRLLGISVIAILLMASCAPTHKKTITVTVTTDSTKSVNVDSVNVDSVATDSVSEQ